MKRIVLGYDASPTAQRALERTAQLAAAFESSVLVASVAPVYELARREVETHDEPSARTALHAEMAEDAVARLTELGVEAMPLTGLGHTAETLVELADEGEADLIVVGMSSRDVPTSIFGGVSDDVAHEANCDVLLVH